MYLMYGEKKIFVKFVYWEEEIATMCNLNLSVFFLFSEAFMPFSHDENISHGYR